MTDPIQYLRNFLESNSFKALYDTFGINARASKDGSKWSLNYDQIASKPGCKIAEVCRGIVIRPSRTITSSDEIVGDFSIVARGMDRFYNAGESHAAEIDWKTARIQEKLDGTNILLYWDSVKQEWCVATRSVPEADVSFGDPPGSPLPENTFYELFKYACWKDKGNYTFDEWCSYADKEQTYVFELTTPLNRVVVKYDDYTLTLLCSRNTQTGAYDTGVCVYDSVAEWPLQTLADLTDLVNNMDPAKCEGAVVVDANWNRIKVKNKAWVLASRTKDCVTMSKRNALQCIIDGQIDDVMPLLDIHVAQYMENLRCSLYYLVLRINNAFQTFKIATADRKEFALAVQASGLWQTPFFALYSGNGGKYANCLDWLRSLSKNDKLTPTMLDTILQEIDKE